MKFYPMCIMLTALVGLSTSMPALRDTATHYRAPRQAPAVPFPDEVTTNGVAPVIDAAKIAAYLNVVDIGDIDVVAANSSAGDLLPKITKRTYRGNPEESGPYFQGDIILPARKNGVRRASQRWPDGIIPYVLSDGFSASDLRLFQEAFDDYHKYTCIRFVRRQNQADYITITDYNSGCFSNIGYLNDGYQQVNIQSPGCNIKATIIHELMHTVGFWHEQNRGDRDQYVNIITQNIEKGRSFNFVNKGAETTTLGVEYDYGSVMHYSPDAFSSNGLPTITPKRNLNGRVMGQRRGFANSDVARINRMYNCKNHYQG